MPPPESDAWPEPYRGANWRPTYAFIFAGKCQLCAHSCPLSKSRQLRDKWTGTTRLLQCTNHPACPGEIEAAKARDRKAYELHGKPACFNFPEDYGL